MSARTPPPRARHHFTQVAKFDRREIQRAVSEVEGFNAKVAVLITRGVGTMACAYLFGLIALISLPAAIASSNVIIIVAWIAQTFLQLVLLSIIMVGQQVQARASDVRATQTFEDTEKILDRLDVTTEGGMKVIVDRIAQLSDRLDTA